jgi:hypothetical protein
MTIARVALRRFVAPADCGPACDGLTLSAPGVLETADPVRVALLGGSLAFAGPPGSAAGESIAERIALQVSAGRDRPVRVRNVAAHGAGPESLRGQLHRLLAFVPDLAVIVIGDGDLRHRSVCGSVRQLALTVHRLQLLGAAVALGCPPALHTALAPLFAPDRTLLTSVAEIAIPDPIAQPAAV